RSSDAEKCGYDSGFGVAKFWSGGVANHFQSCQASAQIVRNGLAPHRHPEDRTDHVKAAGQGEEEQSKVEVLRKAEKDHGHAPERGGNRDYQTVAVNLRGPA